MASQQTPRAMPWSSGVPDQTTSPGRITRSVRVDAFVAKVSSGGALSWALYLGGSGWDSGCGIALDPWGNAVVTGQTDSTDLAGANSSYKGGSRDAFLAKIAASPDDIAGRLADGCWYVAASTGQSFDTQYWGLWGAQGLLITHPTGRSRVRRLRPPAWKNAGRDSMKRTLRSMRCGHRKRCAAWRFRRQWLGEPCRRRR